MDINKLLDLKETPILDIIHDIQGEGLNSITLVSDIELQWTRFINENNILVNPGSGIFSRVFKENSFRHSVFFNLHPFSECSINLNSGAKFDPKRLKINFKVDASVSERNLWIYAWKDTCQFLGSSDLVLTFKNSAKVLEEMAGFSLKATHVDFSDLGCDNIFEYNYLLDTLIRGLTTEESNDRQWIKNVRVKAKDFANQRKKVLDMMFEKLKQKEIVFSHDDDSLKF